MFDIDNIREIWATITKNKTRSFFTAFGVFWGMLMLMVMLGFGLGIERNMLNQWGDTSANAAFFFQGTTSMPYKGFKRGRRIQYKRDDIKALINQFPEIENISPVIWGSVKKMTHADKSTENLQSLGLSSAYNVINPCRILEGRFINDIDVQQNRKVCVIGSKVKNTLFGGNEATGALVWVNGTAYTVIGVMEKQADINIFSNPEESIYTPYTTLAQSSNLGDNIDCIGLSVSKSINIQDFEDEAVAFLKERHNVAPEDEQGIGHFNTKQFFDTFANLFLGLRILIWIVGLGTLAAGMVGISNIMLVTVKERTQEIGIRRALGASPFVIIRQIMNESLVLALIAGVVGLTTGVLISMGLDSIMSAMPEEESFIDGVYVPFNVAIVVLGILIMSGLLSGLLPAYRAVQIKAIDALRDE